LGRDGGLSQTTERFESNLTAVDPVTGELKKSVHLRYPNYSGTLATAGGLIFFGLLDGTVAAFDDTTLDELWKINMICLRYDGGHGGASALFSHY
jgi:alcohol dehydrogenase (cytochrome c)